MNKRKTSEEPSSNFQEGMFLDILKQKLEEGKSLTTLAVTIFTVYLAVNAALMKFASDKYTVGNPPVAFSIVGSIVSAIYLAASIFQQHVRTHIKRDIEHLNKLLNKPLISEQLSGLKYVSVTTALFSFLVLIVWILLGVGWVKFQ
jgi:hypothetical protein